MELRDLIDYSDWRRKIIQQHEYYGLSQDTLDLLRNPELNFEDIDKLIQLELYGVDTSGYTKEEINTDYISDSLRILGYSLKEESPLIHERYISTIKGQYLFIEPVIKRLVKIPEEEYVKRYEQIRNTKEYEKYMEGSNSLMLSVIPYLVCQQYDPVKFNMGLKENHPDNNEFLIDLFNQGYGLLPEVAEYLHNHTDGLTVGTGLLKLHSDIMHELSLTGRCSIMIDTKYHMWERLLILDIYEDSGVDIRLIINDETNLQNVDSLEDFGLTTEEIINYRKLSNQFREERLGRVKEVDKCRLQI